MKPVVVALVLVTALLSRAYADDAKPLVIGASQFPPVMIKNADGSWSGICVDAWTHVATEAGLTSTWKEIDPAELIAKGPVALGLDVATCIPVNPRTEKVMDVTHPFYIGGIGIATRTEASSGLGRIAGKLASWRFARNLGLLLLIIVIVGVVVWRVEHETSPDEFGGTPLSGIGGGIFWTVESLFAKPKPLSRRLRSRFLSLFWVIACMILVSGVTAKLAAEFTVTQLSGTVAGPKDLDHARVGATIATNGNHGVGARYLDSKGIGYRSFAGDHGLDQALDALARGELDAVVDNSIRLRYIIATQHAGDLLTLPDNMQPATLAFGLQLASPLRKQLDRAILKLYEADDFKHIVSQYVGGMAD
jgi:ABC-type amino acid transport substrate-binding protein